jgi:hypothetical protein
MFSETDIIKTLEFLIDNICVMLGGHVWHRVPTVLPFNLFHDLFVEDYRNKVEVILLIYLVILTGDYRYFFKG